jgi:hypothetical protein
MRSAAARVSSICFRIRLWISLFSSCSCWALRLAEREALALSLVPSREKTPSLTIPAFWQTRRTSRKRVSKRETFFWRGEPFGSGDSGMVGGVVSRDHTEVDVLQASLGDLAGRTYPAGIGEEEGDHHLRVEGSGSRAVFPLVLVKRGEIPAWSAGSQSFTEGGKRNIWSRSRWMKL